jgi:predicted metal-dependent hydrolase
VKKGASVTYTATLKPDPGQGQRVQFLIYQYVNGAWQYSNQRTYFTNGASQVTLTWKWSTAGKWYVRATAPTNDYYAQGYSPTSVVNVK